MMEAIRHERGLLIALSAFARACALTLYQSDRATLSGDADEWAPGSARLSSDSL